MNETGQDTLTPALDSLKKRVEDLQTKVNEQKAIIAAEKAKGRKADQNAIDGAKNALLAMNDSVDALFLEFRKLRSSKPSQEQSVTIGELRAAISEGDTSLDSQIETLVREANEVAASIPGVNSEAEAQRMVEKISEKEDPSDTEQLVVYLFNEVQRLKAEGAGKGASATPVESTPPASTPENTGAAEPVVEPAKIETKASEDDEDGDVIDFGEMGKKALEKMSKLWQKVTRVEQRRRNRVKDAMQSAIGADLDTVAGILEKPEKPESSRKAMNRQHVLIPVLAILSENSILQMTDEAKALIPEYTDEIDALNKKLAEEHGGKKDLLTLTLWARSNIEKFEKLPEVVGGGETATPPAQTETVPPEKPVSPVDAGDAGNGAPPADEAPKPPVEAKPAKTESKTETESQKQMKEIYRKVRERIAENADEATKLNFLITRESSRPRVLNGAVQNFTEILNGADKKFQEDLLTEEMTVLLIVSEVPKAYDGLRPKPKESMDDLKALVARIAS